MAIILWSLKKPSLWQIGLMQIVESNVWLWIKAQTAKAWISNQREKFLASEGVGTREPKQGWLRFGFPLHYNSDILEAMYALAIIGTPMFPNLQKPLQVIKDKMTSDGRWKMENSLNGKMWVDVEEKGKPSKWITYFANLLSPIYRSF